MNAAALACAPSGTSWEAIDWIAVQRRVRGLQARIVKAVQDGRHNKVKALQWLLTHSFSGKVRIPRHPATQPTNIRPPVPRSSGRAVGAQRRRFALLV